ncbi:MAG: class I SAM-dependent methyltransferase [Kofleriaceae bacterium]|nr:class I SAM-dependent methyltransferase [Kofleriaceae bacterium]
MDHWTLHARNWARVGPPLRPSAEDVAWTEQAIATWHEGRAARPVRGIVLGATPELVGMAWPEGATVLAVDRARAMLDALFVPGRGRSAIVGDWLALPVDASSTELVVGDGCLTLFAFPGTYNSLATELARVLAPGGLLLLRLFVAPGRPEPLEAIRRSLASPAPGDSFDALKWRIAMAIQPASRNVRVADIRAAFDELVPDRAALAARTGWRREVIDHIDIYRDSPTTYSFPTLDETRATLAPWFIERACHVPSYVLGDRCPTLVLEPRVGP